MEINNKLLLGTDNEGWTVWQLAAMGGRLETLKKVWEWAKENLTIEEINNNVLLDTDNEGWTVWHLAAMGGRLETLKKLWELAKENLTVEEIKCYLAHKIREGPSGTAQQWRAM